MKVRERMTRVKNACELVYARKLVKARKSSRSADDLQFLGGKLSKRGTPGPAEQAWRSKDFIMEDEGGGRAGEGGGGGRERGSMKIIIFYKIIYNLGKNDQ